MRVAIVGAGITGLTAAYDLAKAGHTVTVFESAPITGGLAAGFKSERWAWPLEHFYHHWFESDRDILDLIDEIGEGDKVFFPRPTTSLYVDGQIYPFDSPLRMLLYPKLPLIPKLRFGLTGLYLRLTKNWQALEQETAHNWLIRTMGQTAYDQLWKPLLVGKFGEYYQEVNMAWFWARIHKRSPRLGYFEGGFQGFVDALTNTVQSLGVEIHLNTTICAITRLEPGSFQIAHQSRQADTAPCSTEACFDRVLITVSPHLLSRLVPNLPADYLASLQQLKSMGAVVIVLALKHALTRQHYWVNIPKEEGFPYLALVEHTNFVDRQHYGGDHIIYCGDYLSADHEYFDLTKEELLARFLPTLRRINPNFDESWVKESWRFQAKYAQPVPPINHSAHIPAIETPISGLYWASMSQVYPWDRGTNYAVEIGRRAAKLIMQSRP
ncbi:MAG: NAD(P)/FAD-dependent oxidoreductase [Anaerolineae bacterium]|nr:NAD(P)/FAD-dependent oxidoreductase [Anaerolineae bacterium]